MSLEKRWFDVIVNNLKTTEVCGVHAKEQIQIKGEDEFKQFEQEKRRKQREIRRTRWEVYS